MTAVPEKYQPEPRLYEQKDWLYEQYWGELRSAGDLADDADTGHKTILEWMEKYGIPTRTDGFKRDNSVSPFRGFYRDEAARTDEQSRQHFDPDHESQQRDTSDFEWSFTDYSGGDS